jgi:hypothetical protein
MERRGLGAVGRLDFEAVPILSPEDVGEGASVLE